MNEHALLLDILQQSQSPEKRLYSLLKLACSFVDFEQPEAVQCTEEALRLASELGDAAAKAFLYSDKLMLDIVRGRTEGLQPILSELLSNLHKIKGQTLYYFLSGQLLAFLASAFENVDYHKQAIHYYYQCLQQVEEIPAQSYQSHFFFDIKTRTLCNLAYSFIVLERYEEAETHLKLAEYFITELCTVGDKIDLYHWQTRLYFRQGRYEESIQAANKSLALSEHSKFPAMRNCLTYNLKGQALLLYKKDSKQALQCFELATELGKKFDYWMLVGTNYGYQGCCYEEWGDYKQAAFCYKQAAEYQRKGGLCYLNQAYRLVRAQLSTTDFSDQQTYVFFHQLLRVESAGLPANESEAARYFTWIYQHCSNKNLSVEHIAQFFNVSTRTVNRKLHHLFNLSALQFINLARLKKAHMLLTTTSMPVLEVATSVGIEHFSYFSVSFRKYFGVSPSQVRKAAS